MYFKQFYLGCLAHASYLIGCAGEAAVIDPQRDIDQYLAEASAQGLKIKYIIETHLHADFVSGHRELAARTGAQIIFGEKAGAKFDYLPIKDGDEVAVGTVKLRFLTTPGHTPESISILLIDPQVSDQPVKVFTGDTLFIGDVGRPDLAGAKGYTAETMAGLLYDSLHEKLLKLDDSVEVYPAHGAGSLCGRNLSQERSSTIGQQRRFNYALQQMSRDEFIEMMTSDLPAAPVYFSRDAELNRSGANLLSELPKPIALTPAEVNKLAQQGAYILDVRAAAAYGNGHIPGSINIGLSGQFASWAGALIPFNREIIIVGEDNANVDEAVTRLARVGLENVKGYLAGGIDSWLAEGLTSEQLPQLSLEQLHQQISEQIDLQIIDVRRPGEYQNGHVPGAINRQLTELVAHADQFDRTRSTAIICASGYRSNIAGGLLKQLGFPQVANVVGGTNGWINAGYDVIKEAVAGAK